MTHERRLQLRSMGYRAGRDRGLKHQAANEFAEFFVGAIEAEGEWLSLHDAWLLFQGTDHRDGESK